MKVKSLKPPLTSLSYSMKYHSRRNTTSTSNAWLPGVFDIKDFIEGVNLHPVEKPATVQPLDEAQRPTGGTRWNPLPEQIDILEALYARGLRTPNAEGIEHITSKLRQYGRIEGKNVFYWFQNHKARERQKQKRYSVLTFANSSPSHGFYDVKDREEYIDGQCQRRCRSWGNANQINKEGGKERTLVLFPLHPEGW